MHCHYHNQKFAGERCPLCERDQIRVVTCETDKVGRVHDTMREQGLELHPHSFAVLIFRSSPPTFRPEITNRMALACALQELREAHGKIDAVTRCVRDYANDGKLWQDLASLCARAGELCDRLEATPASTSPTPWLKPGSELPKVEVSLFTSNSRGQLPVASGEKGAQQA